MPALIRTMIVDDDFRVAQIHAAYVERIPGFQVVGQVHTAAAAVEEIARLEPHLVLLDLYLPDEHGFELIGRLRRSAGTGVDVIVITAAKEPEDLRRAIHLGAVHYLLKPFTFEVFREKLTTYAAMRAQLAQLPPTISDQRHVDRVLGTLRGPPAAERSSPKGLSPQTLEAVEGVLAQCPEGVSAQRVAARTGMSRATAQRYLAYLESVGRAVIRPRYGAAGRPEHIYLSVDRASDFGITSQPSG